MLFLIDWPLFTGFENCFRDCSIKSRRSCSWLFFRHILIFISKFLFLCPILLFYNSIFPNFLLSFDKTAFNSVNKNAPSDCYSVLLSLFYFCLLFSSTFTSSSSLSLIRRSLSCFSLAFCFSKVEILLSIS